MLFRSLLAVGSAITLFSIVTLGQPVAAQSTASTDVPTAAATVVNSPDCIPATVIKGLPSIKSANDKTKDMNSLLALRDQINAQEAACNGLFWKGTGYKSIGPISLPSGSYLVHLVTAGYFQIHGKVLSGDCSTTSGDVDYLFNLSPGDATDGADTDLDSTNCRILLLTDNTSAPWTVSISQIQ